MGDTMNDLNGLLQDWSARQEPAPVELDSLQARIAEQFARTDVGAIRRLGLRPDPLTTRVGTESQPTSASWLAVVVVAASLLAAVTVFWSGRFDDSSRSMNGPLASLPTGNLAARQSLFSELDRMFDGRWRWLSEVNGQVHVETNEPSASPANLPGDDSSGVAVRLTIVQRRPGESNWKVVWEASVLARSEEWVRLPVELSGNSEVSMWAYALPDGSTLVESDVALTVPVSVRLSEQHVFGSSGRPARLWSARRSDGEFQLIQSVARMEAHHG